MSTIKRVVLCVALLSAAANGLRLGDKALDPREDVDAASSSKEDFASRLADSAGKAALLADADTTFKETVEGSSEIGKLKTTSGAAKALDAEFSASGVADETRISTRTVGGVKKEKKNIAWPRARTRIEDPNVSRAAAAPSRPTEPSRAPPRYVLFV